MQLNQHKPNTKHTMQNILNINGARFARNDSEFVKTLFDNDGTACGLFKIRKRGIEFMKPNGELFAFLSASKNCEKFFVSAFKLYGKKRYMCSTSREADEMLNLSELGYRDKIELARKTWESATNSCN